MATERIGTSHISMGRQLAAAAAAPIVALMVPTLVLVSTVAGGPIAITEGDLATDLNDTPARVAGAFLFVGVPVAFVVGFTFYGLLGRFLARTGKLTLRNVLLSCATAPWSLVALMLWGIARNNGPGAVSIELAFLAGAGAFMSACACAGGWTWWRIIAAWSVVGDDGPLNRGI